MLFCTREFLLFFLAVFFTYWLTPWHRVRVWLLVAASFFFYGWWNQGLAALILVTSCLDYVFALGMQRSTTERSRKTFLVVSLIMNLGLLVYFKYSNFFVQSFVDGLHAFGYTGSVGLLSVVLPVGISFYTFEAINYTVDVYRRKIPAERNLGHLLLFITFFPHLVAGPIVRASDFLKQIKRRKHWSWPRMTLGVSLFLLGWLKKSALAEHMARFADPIFQNPELYGTGATWIAVLAYALQIYGDFSGYSDMALGTAHMLGYRLALNFDMPYLSANIAEFWRRWHISLSSWLRDYLFIPLGGSRGSMFAACRNLLITMTLGGLWHGASWNFVLWGVLHGSLLAGHRVFREVCERLPRLKNALESHAGTCVRTGLTFLFVILAWVLFRATSLHAAMTVLGRLVPGHHGLAAPVELYVFWASAAAVVLTHLIGATGMRKTLYERLPAPALGTAFAMGLVVVLLLSAETVKTFIYFQF
jgi:alginate O-acetyltransferase complex protein AlgI